MPTINDYDEAIRAGRVRFKDADLRQAKPEMNKRAVSTGYIEEPWRAPGSFAVAYKMKMADGKLRAVRCYFSDKVASSQHSQRYRALSAELPARLKEYTVDFRYLEQGIRADNAASAPYLPVVDMEWVQGSELRQYVANIADQRKTAELRALAEAWLVMMARMRAANIAHGDLSGNNIMVRDNGALVLIDYDGMYTQTLASVNSGEAGAPEYQHPTAVDKRKYGPEMDRFSALLIYVALRALQERPDLWRSHAEYSGQGTANLASDRMLFKTEDLKDPSTSALFRELGALKDPLTLKLVEALKRACVEDIGRTPWVVDLVEQADPLAALKSAIKSDDDQKIVTAATQATMALPAAGAYNKRVSDARANLAAISQFHAAVAKGEDAGAISAAGRMTDTATTRQLKPQVEKARERVALFKQLRDAIGAHDYGAIQRIEAQLQGAADLKSYEAAIRHEWVRAERVNAARRALDAGKDALALRIWKLAETDERGASLFEPLRARIEQAQARAGGGQPI